MKKLITALLILAALLFTGCKHNAKEKDDGTVSKTIKIDRDGEVYLVKFNPTYRTIYGSDSGYIKKLSRSAAEEANEKDSDFFIRNLNSRIGELLVKQGSARAASVTVKEGIKTLPDVIVDTSKDNFYSYTAEDTSTLIENAICKYTGKHCIIYADPKNDALFGKSGYIALEDYDALGKKFDSVYETETGIIGNPKYSKYIEEYFVQCTNKITIFVSDLFGDAKEGQDSGTVGYFYSGDLLNKNLLAGTSYNTNQREMFYIDTVFLKESPSVVYSTLVHEFNHMINFVIKTVNNSTNNELTKYSLAQICETWFTEMLAMTTEDMFQKVLDIEDEHSPKGRLPYFGLFYNYGFNNWNNKKVDQLMMYANTYAFGAFLARNFGGIPLIKEIAQNDYVNERAITEALQKINPNMTYVDPVTNETKKVDFTFALQKFVNCVIFPESSSEYSLNKGNGFTDTYGSKIGFSPIDIRWDVEYLGKYYRLPRKFSREKGEQPDLYSYGFSVHHVGTNISSFTLTMPKESSLEYYYIIK